jgi:HAD superfamily hydrolase (TIGR01509 family)
MKSIYDYSLYLFDLDGTLITSELLHYKSYKLAIQKYNINIDFSYKDYVKLAHGINSTFKTIIKAYVNDFDEFYKFKEDTFKSLKNELQFIDGAENFLKNLIKKNKEICIVTHSSAKRVEIVKTKLPFLKKIKYWITKDVCFNKKPNPECFIRAIKLFNIPFDQIIGFEDSYKGYKALESLPISKVIIQNSEYYYYNEMKCNNKFINYDNINNIKNYEYKSNIENKIKLYTSQFNYFSQSISNIISLSVPFLKECKGTIYLCGIGKSNHICNKSVSTWQSLGINTRNVYVQDLNHGDYGMFNDNDIIIYISNSGNTSELVNVSKYIKDTFNIFQISISNNYHSKIANNTNFSFVLGDKKIIEADKINMAPSISSSLFMLLLDLIGITISENNKITINTFKKYHPGGTLGSIIKKNKPIDYVCIFASGKGSRLQPITNYIPKILVNMKNHNLLTKIIEYWKEYTNNFIVIITPEYKSLVSSYLSLLKINFHLITVEIDKQENSYTIRKSLGNKFNNKKLLFTWCDIYPNDKIPKNLFQNENIIFTHGNKCRYFAKNNELIKRDNGNVIGIFYFSNYKGITDCNDKLDLCDVYLDNYDKFTTFDIKKLYDIGDMKKLKTFLLDNNNNYDTRFFNRIYEQSDNLVKEALCEQGYQIMKKETNWYKFVNKNYIPKILSYGKNKFMMNKLNCNPLYKVFWNLSFENQSNIVNKIFMQLNDLHSQKIKIDNNIIIEDTMIEIKHKIELRLQKVKEMIKSFGRVEYVNGKKINNDINFILKNISSKIERYISDKREYSVIHGDCQFSNTLCDKDRNIYFIDPRGYYGNSSIYGLKEYDYAKVLYALSGYDQFNNDNLYFIQKYENNHLTLNINNNMEKFKHIFEKYTDFNIIKNLVVINWLGLTQYNQNNILKCISSYYYALYLFD